MPKKKRPTPRQAKLIKNLSKGMTITKAAENAGYSKDYPGQAGSQALDQMRHTFPELLDAHGLTNESLIENYLKPGLKADNTEFAKMFGGFTASKKVPAWSERRGFLDMAFKLKGSYAPTKVEGGDRPIQVVVVTNIERPDRSRQVNV